MVPFSVCALVTVQSPVHFGNMKKMKRLGNFKVLNFEALQELKRLTEETVRRVRRDF